jgi:hypothetical protein
MSKITPETRARAEKRAFEAYKEVLEAAFEADGFRGVVHMADSLHRQVVSLNDNFSEKKKLDACLQEVADFITTIWSGMVLGQLEQLKKDGGLKAVLAKKAEAAKAVKPAVPAVPAKKPAGKKTKTK